MILFGRGRTLRALLALPLLALPASVDASSFALESQGARAMGFSGAYVAQAADPSAIYYNAAGIGFLKGKNLYIGAFLGGLSTDFTGEGPYPAAGTLELQQQRLHHPGRAHTGRIERLDQFHRLLHHARPDFHAPAQFLRWQIEKSTLIEISQQNRRRLAHVRLDHGKIQLLPQVLLQGLWRDDRLIQMLSALLVLLRPWRRTPFHDLTVAPVVVGLVEVLQRVRITVVSFVERDRLGDILEHRIDLQRLGDELAQLHRPGLQDLQALAHLRRERLLLRQRLVEIEIRHGRQQVAGIKLRPRINY